MQITSSERKLVHNQQSPNNSPEENLAHLIKCQLRPIVTLATYMFFKRLITYMHIKFQKYSNCC